MFHFAFDELRSHRKQKIDQFGEEGTNYAPFVQNTKTMLSQKVRLFGQIFNPEMNLRFHQQMAYFNDI